MSDPSKTPAWQTTFFLLLATGGFIVSAVYRPVWTLTVCGGCLWLLYQLKKRPPLE